MHFYHRLFPPSNADKTNHDGQLGQQNAVFEFLTRKFRAGSMHPHHGNHSRATGFEENIKQCSSTDNLIVVTSEMACESF